jgi:hypothetical protein
MELKNEGNSKYREPKFEDALEAYTSKQLPSIYIFPSLYLLFFIEAIETCPPESTEELSQFYQNRAATWESLVFNLILLFKLHYLFYLERLRKSY